MTDLYKTVDHVLNTIWMDAAMKVKKSNYDPDGIAEICQETHDLYKKISVRVDEYASGALASYKHYKMEEETGDGMSQASVDKVRSSVNKTWISVEGSIEACEEGGFHISIPELPGVQSQGETIDEAEKNVVDALRELVSHRVSVQEDK